MKVNGPPPLTIQSNSNAPAAKSQVPGPFGPRTFGFTEFPESSELGPHTRALLDQLPPVPAEVIVSLAKSHQQHIPYAP